MPQRAKLITRSGTTANSTENLAKGSKLQFNEMDGNFIGLRDQSFGVVADDSATIDVKAGDTLYVQGTGGIQTSTDSAGQLTIDGSNLSSLGDLTAIGSTLVSPSNAAITLDPSGTGTIELNANTNITGNLSVSGSISGADITFVGDDSTGTVVDLGETFKFAGAGGVTTAVSGDTLTITGPTGTLSNVVEDTTPQLGGDLDLNSNDITGTGNVNITGSVTASTSIANDAITINDNHITGTRSGEDIVISTNSSGNIILDGYQIYIGDDDSTGPNPWRNYTGVYNTSIRTNPPTIRTPGLDDDLVFQTRDSGSDIGGRFRFRNGGQAHCHLALMNASVSGGQHWIGAAGINGETIIANGIALENALTTDPHTLFNEGYYSAKIVVHSGDGFSVSSADIDLIPLGGGEVNISKVDINSGAIDGTTIGAASAASGTFTTIKSTSGQIGGTTSLTLGADFNNITTTSNIQLGSASSTNAISIHPDAGAGSQAGIRIYDPGNTTADVLMDFYGSGKTTIQSGGTLELVTADTTVATDLIALGANRGSEVMLTTNAAKDLVLSTYLDTNSGTIRITDGVNGDITLSPNGTGAIDVDTSRIINVTDPTSAQDAATKAYVDANAGSANTGDITFVGSTMSSPSNANFTIETAGTGKIILTGITFPDTDGTADQILGTNGSGVLSFRDPTAINIDGGTADSVYTSVPTIDGGTA